MQITFKRNGLKNYMMIKNERPGAAGLREKMIVRNNIGSLIKMTPQNIDGHTYYHYDIQGRICMEALFSGRKMKRNEVSAILSGLSSLFTELQQYLLSAEDVLFAPSCIWLLPDTLEPAFIYVPDMIPDDQYGILNLAEFLTEHVDGNDREAAAIAYGYLEMVENGCILPKLNNMDSTFHEFSGLNTVTVSPYQDPPFAANDESWAVKESISDEMRPFFDESEGQHNTPDKKKAAYISLGLVISVSMGYILFLLNPSLLPVSVSDEDYMTAGIIIAIVFATVLIAVMLVCRKKTSGPTEQKDIFPADIKMSSEDSLEYMEYENNRSDDDEKTVLIRKPLSKEPYRACPVLQYADGRNIPISTLPFLIGKMKSRVDGFIEGKGVSRIHAILKELDGRYYLSDLNSLNGTEINGRPLTADETVEVSEGDIISFADISLTFHTVTG